MLIVAKTNKACYYTVLYSHSCSTIQHSAYTKKKYIGKKRGVGRAGMLKSERKTTLILVFETSKFGQRHLLATDIHQITCQFQYPLVIASNIETMCPVIGLIRMLMDQICDVSA